VGGVGDYLGLMAKRGPKKQTEGEQYRALIADDVEWARPTLTTAREVCGLVGVAPMTLRASRVQDEADAAQAFVVALDYLLSVGDSGPEGAQLLWNGVFDAVARHWSVSYRDAQQRGTPVSYYMDKVTTLPAAWQELRWAGFDLEAIWTRLLSRTGRLASLYTVGRTSGRGHARGHRVKLIEGQLLDDVRYAILRDPQYARPDRRRLLLADEEAPPLPARQAMSEERPYETVVLGERSRRVIARLESARSRFNVERFRQDYEARPDPAWRVIYEQTAGLVPVRGFVEIKSRFFRALNRRFHAADFWPEHVSAEQRERWFVAEEIDEHFEVIDDERDRFIEVGDYYPNKFVERDISSSQTQIRPGGAGLRSEEEVQGLAGRAPLGAARSDARRSPGRRVHRPGRRAPGRLHQGDLDAPELRREAR